MKNIPRVFIGQKLEEGAVVPLTDSGLRYLVRVMRTDKFLAFNDGAEYNAIILVNRAKILEKTKHIDPSGNWTLCFAPIKKMEDLIAGAVQMGVGRLQPVITEHTVARHVKWERMKKIIIENSEQSGRNSLPELLPPIPFRSLDKKGLAFGDERKAAPSARSHNLGPAIKPRDDNVLFIGPEGGFSDAEFAVLDKEGAIGISLGSTILRSEVAAVALAAKLIGNK